MAHILIVEDDAGLSHGIELSLQGEGHHMTLCAAAAQARQAFAREPVDLVLLDIGLPDQSGIALCRALREQSDVPILFLTANDTEICEVAALESGGDDFLAKPFSLAVLRARVAALLRRGMRAKTPGVYQSGGLRFDFESMSFFKNGTQIALSRTEQRILRLLVENRGRTLSREMLLDRVWDGGAFVEENALSVAVRRLRSKLEDDPRRPRRIETVYGIGYVWREDAP